MSHICYIDLVPSREQFLAPHSVMLDQYPSLLNRAFSACSLQFLVLIFGPKSCYLSYQKSLLVYYSLKAS
jgi:hypothetical protein